MADQGQQGYKQKEMKGICELALRKWQR